MEVLRPFVFWGQKNDSISLRIDLQNVTVDKLNLTEDRLEINLDGVGAQGRNKYGFELDFYLPVDPDESKFRSTDRVVEFSIKKKGSEAWPRLTEKQQRLPWLKVDFDKFTFDDDTEDEDARMSEQQASEEIMRKIEKDLQQDSKGDKEMDPKTSYLVGYNFLQFVGFCYVFFVLLYNRLKQGAGVEQKAFELAGQPIMICQALAVLEIIHPMIGLVKTGVLSPLMQVVGRNFILFALILQDIRLQDAPIVWYLFMTWSCVELIRYPFYMFSSIGVDIKIVSWLRYTAWVPLYPIGILCEGTIVIMSIPLFEESLKFSLQLPNTANFAFYFPWFLHVYLLVLATAGYKMMMHMYSLRKKKLSAPVSSKKKQ